MPTTAVDLAAYLTSAQVSILADSPAKSVLLDRLIVLMASSGVITDLAAFRKAIFDREEITSTAIGGGIAVPHARLDSIRDFALVLAIIPQGTDLGARDGLPVRVAVMIASPEDERHRHLQVLAAVAARLGNPERCESLVSAKDISSAMRAFLSW